MLYFDDSGTVRIDKIESFKNAAAQMALLKTRTSVPPIFRSFILYTNYCIRVIVVSFNRVVELLRNDMRNQQCRLTGKIVRLSTDGEINVLHVFPRLWIFVTIRPCNPCKRAHNSSV